MKTELIEYHLSEARRFHTMAHIESNREMRDWHKRAVAWLESLAEDTPTLNIVHTPEGLTFIKPPA